MKYNNDFVYKGIKKVLDRLDDYIEEELEDEFKSIKKTSPDKITDAIEYSKSYFITSGLIEGLTRIKTKIALEKEKMKLYD